MLSGIVVDSMGGRVSSKKDLLVDWLPDLLVFFSNPSKVVRILEFVIMASMVVNDFSVDVLGSTKHFLSFLSNSEVRLNTM